MMNRAMPWVPALMMLAVGCAAERPVVEPEAPEAQAKVPEQDRPEAAEGLSLRDLVRTEVRGTKLDMVPDSVDFFVDDLETAVAAARELGIDPQGINDNALWFRYRNVDYFAIVPAADKAYVEAVRMRPGDVVYRFLLESGDQRTVLRETASLEQVGSTKNPDGSTTPFFRASPGHYVWLLVPVQVRGCPMHPDVRVEEDDESCPICGMDLVGHQTVYQ